MMLSGNISLTGGALMTAVSAGQTTSIVLLDEYDHPTSVGSVYCPESIAAKHLVLVLHKGSLLLNGHYTAAAASYHNQAGQTVPVALDNTNALAQDTLVISDVAGAGGFTLPIDSNGAASFPNGVFFTAIGDFLQFNEDTLTYSMMGSPLTTVGSTNNVTGSYSYAGKYPSSNLLLTFNGATSNDFFKVTSNGGTSPVQLVGQWQGSTVLTNARVQWTLND